MWLQFTETSIGKIRKKNNFRVVSSKQYRGHNLSSDSRESLADLLKKEKDRIVYDRHFYYFNFTSHKLSLNLINMVRDPVERIISNFFYVRSPARWNQREVSPAQSWILKSFDDCVQSNDIECQIGVGGRSQEYQMRYFCDACDGLSDKEMMLAAMVTVEKEYAVVGVLEMFQASLTVFQNYLPEWFNGAEASFASVTRNFYNHNPHATVSNKTRQILREKLNFDLEFYNFVKQRLNLQISRINTRQ